MIIVNMICEMRMLIITVIFFLQFEVPRHLVNEEQRKLVEKNIVREV